MHVAVIFTWLLSMDCLSFYLLLWNSALLFPIRRWKINFSKLTNSRSPTIAESFEQPNWCQLHTDVLELILKKLAFIDILRFEAVCTSWKIAVGSYISSPFYNPFSQAPWLVVRSDQHNHYRFLSLTDSKFYYPKQKTKHGTFMASSHGWMLTFDKTGDTNHLVNMFSGAKIEIPLISNLMADKNMYHVRSKVVMASDPRHCSKNLSIAIMYRKHRRNRLAFCKYGDKKWTPTMLEDQSYSDIICENGQIYALSISGTVDIWDFHSNFPKESVAFGQFPAVSVSLFDQWLPFRDKEVQITYTNKMYLVKSMGDIVAVERIMLDVDPFSTFGFIVFKLDFCKRSRKPVESLPDRAIFIGSKLSLSVSIRDCPEVEENSIYFVEDCLRVYNLKEGKINKRQNEKWKDIAWNNITDIEKHFWLFPNPW